MNQQEMTEKLTQLSQLASEMMENLEKANKPLKAQPMPEDIGGFQEYASHQQEAIYSFVIGSQTIALFRNDGHHTIVNAVDDEIVQLAVTKPTATFADISKSFSDNITAIISHHVVRAEEAEDEDDTSTDPRTELRELIAKALAKAKQNSMN